MFFSKSRTYHDPIHGAITLNGGDRTESLLIQLIDTPEFQRLRRIRQLDIAAFTFHGAEGSRFTHALGVMALTRRAFDAITLEYPYLAMHRPVALVAALLHDLGHGPYSHAAEEVFHSQHEIWTLNLLKFGKIGELLHDFSEQLLPDLEQVFTKQYAVPFVYLVLIQLTRQRDRGRVHHPMLLRSCHQNDRQSAKPMILMFVIHGDRRLSQPMWCET